MSVERAICRFCGDPIDVQPGNALHELEAVAEAHLVCDPKGAHGMIECGACGGPLVLLGVLGRVAWCRCRDCGLDQNVLAEPSKPVDEKPSPAP